VRDRLLRSLLLGSPALVGGLVAVFGSVDLTAFGVAVVAYVVAHVFAVPSRSGSHITFVAAVATVVAMFNDGAPVMVVAAYGVALPLGWLVVHLRYGRRAVDDVFPAVPAAIVGSGLVFFAGSYLVGSPMHRNSASLVVLCIAAAVWFVTSASTRAFASEQGRFTARRLLVVQGLEDWPSYLSVFASAAMFATTFGVMGLWSVPLAGLPYVFSHVSLGRLRDTDRTYRETMAALSHIPEAAGLVDAGHAERCAELALAVGAEVGLSGSDLKRVEYAALLHDIGKVVLANPGMAAGAYTLTDVATWSSVIISEAAYMAPVGEIVAVQHSPYRRPGEQKDESMPGGAQVLRVVGAYDGAVTGGMSPTESLERLHVGAAYDYAPEVVAALRKVLHRQGTIAG
jgi:hypothetical protein